MISVVDILRRARTSHSREWLFCLLLLFGPAGCGVGEPETVRLNGPTMGTTWSLVYVPAAQQPVPEEVRTGVQAVLDAIDATMSTYREDSELSRLNRATPGSWFQLSGELMQVLMTAIQVGTQSGGAYDVTVGPLVDLWGFGPGAPVVQPPKPEEIQARLAQVGQQHLRFNLHGGSVMKQRKLAVDLSSLAKGYAVDRAARWLGENGVQRFLLEVGGEMKLSGHSGRGDQWRVAIEQPDAGGRAVAATLQASDVAVATSGDYRNFFDYQGKRYSHTIDPRSGWPVAHDLVSVTVVHPSAMLADAWATALSVLGRERAAAVATEQDLAVYFIYRSQDGFTHSHTAPMAAYLPSSTTGAVSAAETGREPGGKS